ncbi:DUF3169 family protein [Bariatricus sp. SGI.154]|uniref:DUF3169 family protein n=1 Tax=Bariatricus sp. SGI.154 TaxID=3420549 RepID=UPI003D093BF8
MKTYLKYALKLLVCICIGAVLGAAIAFIDVSEWDRYAGIIQGIIRNHLFMLLILLTIASIVTGELTLKRMRRLGEEFPDAEDERGDEIEYELEHIGSIGLIGTTTIMVVSIFVLATVYSMSYIGRVVSAGDENLMLSFGIFIALNIYNGYWQMRYVKTIQRIYPDKKADPTSGEFQKQWLENCDEAEREMIYQAAYKTYLRLNRVMPVLTVFAMLGNLMWNTGILAVLLLGIVWITLVVTYCRACTKMKGTKLNI